MISEYLSRLVSRRPTSDSEISKSLRTLESFNRSTEHHGATCSPSEKSARQVFRRGETKHQRIDEDDMVTPLPVETVLAEQAPLHKSTNKCFPIYCSFLFHFQQLTGHPLLRFPVKRQGCLLGIACRWRDQLRR